MVRRPLPDVQYETLNPFMTHNGDPIREAVVSRIGDDAGTPGGQRQTNYRSRRLASGLTQVNVWVPASRQAELCAEAMRLRLESGLVMSGEEDPAQLDLFAPVSAVGATS